MFSRETNFGSGINTASPFTGADYRRNMAGKQSYRGPDQSRSAFARGLLDASNASMYSDMEDARRGYQQKAEQARAQDVASIRQNKLQNYALDQQRAVTTKRQDTFQSQKSADLDAYLDRARKDARAATIGNVANLLIQGAFAAVPSFGAMSKLGVAGMRGLGSGMGIGGQPGLLGGGAGLLGSGLRSAEMGDGLFAGAPILGGVAPLGRLR
ncbi:MAG: hypothetical protein EBS50_10365 [Sphingomonadaceae bacterium]|nr:hypothetical protein [Sphingomonadaceae bacterium]